MLLLSFYYYLFDMIDHGILCKKVEFHGIQQQPLKWFKLYLYNRKEYSRVNGIDTSVMEINVGIPKSSCLGPSYSLFIQRTSHKLSKKESVDECDLS